MIVTRKRHVFAAVAALCFASPVLAADNPKVTQEVIALARAEWAAENANQPAAQQLAAAADDYTEFNADRPVRLDGKAAILVDRDAQADGNNSVSQLMDAKVQTYGDTAILTYSFVGVHKNKDGTSKATNGKSTRVYARIDGKWMLVHGHFSSITG